MYFVLAEVDLVGWVDAILSVLAIIVAILMTFFILLQEGKGGGLAALGGTKAAGVEGVTNPIRKATGYLAAMFFVMIIILGVLHKPSDSMLGDVSPKTESPKMEEATDTKTDAGNATPVAPTVPVAPPAAPANAVTPKTGDTAKPAETKTDASKPADSAKPADVKPADGKGDATKPAEKPTDTKGAEPVKTDASKPVQDDTKKADPKPDGK